jgi:hypothetical protein
MRYSSNNMAADEMGGGGFPAPLSEADWMDYYGNRFFEF